MSDVCAQVLYVVHDEVDAFWTFSAILDRIRTHFDETQSGVRAETDEVCPTTRLFTLLLLLPPSPPLLPSFPRAPLPGFRAFRGLPLRAPEWSRIAQT